MTPENPQHQDDAENNGAQGDPQHDDEDVAFGDDHGDARPSRGGGGAGRGPRGGAGATG